MADNWGGAVWIGSGQQTTKANYTDEIKEVGWKHLEGKQRQQEIEGAIQTENLMFRLRADYWLGDMVVARVPRWHISMVRRVKEIEENWDDGIYTSRIKIGDPKPTVMREVKEAKKGTNPVPMPKFNA
jgi:hypothetical protein